MRLLRIGLVLLVLVPTYALSGEGSASKPSHGKPAPKDKCPVCGMFVAKYPDFLAEIVFKDGSRAFFDGAKDMFKYHLDIKKYDPGKTPTDIAAIYVTDYYSLEPIDGSEAYYVIGSDVYGPMGKELIPFGKEGEAKEFMDDHMGKAILRFREVRDSVVRGLDQ
jgi:copper chaperone NosL